MRTPAFGLAVLLASSLATAAIAQPAPDQPPPGPGGAMSGPPGHNPHNMRDHFDQANTTHDGRLTMDQAQAANWRPIAKHFGEIDRDNKGYVTLQDIHSWMKARHQARVGAMQGPPPGQPQ